MAPAKTLPLATRTATRRLKLRHVSRDKLTIARRRAAEGYAYYAADGKEITDPAILRRFASLAVPPAYEEVYFCPDEQAHLQAVGRDAAGRLQYRYHPDWEKVREAGKAGRLAALALVSSEDSAVQLLSTFPATNPHAILLSRRRSNWWREAPSGRAARSMPRSTVREAQPRC